MEQTNIPDQQANSELPRVNTVINTSFVTVLSNTKDVLEQDYEDYGVLFNNQDNWLDFFKHNYTQALANVLILPPGYNFTYGNVLKTMMAHTIVANNNPLILYGDYQVQHEEYVEQIYLPSVSQTNSSIQFLQEIPLLIYRNDLIQTEVFKNNIYQIFAAILSVHIPQILFQKTT